MTTTPIQRLVTLAQQHTDLLVGACTDHQTIDGPEDPECRVHGIRRCTICTREDALLRDYALDVPLEPPYDTPLASDSPLRNRRKCEFCAPGMLHREGRGWRCDRCFGFWVGA